MVRVTLAMSRPKAQKNPEGTQDKGATAKPDNGETSHPVHAHNTALSDTLQLHLDKVLEVIVASREHRSIGWS